MRPLMEILEDERLLMLKLDTIYQNMIRYPYEDAHELLEAKRVSIKQNLDNVRVEMREYIKGVLDDGKPYNME